MINLQKNRKNTLLLGKWVHNRSVIFFSLLFASAFISASLLPFVDILVQKLGLNYDLHRIYSRVFLIALITGFFYFSSNLGSVSLIKGHLRKERRTGTFFRGFVLGAAILLVITFGAIISDIRVFNKEITLSLLCYKFFSSFITGVIVGFLETLLVWGFIFVFLSKDLGEKVSAVITSFLYAVSHFLRAQDIARTEFFDITIGFRIFAGSFKNIFDLNENGLAIIGLMLLGIYFSILFIRSGQNIFLISGIHAGAVFFIKFNRAILGFLKKDWEWLWGTSMGIDCVGGWLLIIILILLSVRQKKYVGTQRAVSV